MKPSLVVKDCRGSWALVTGASSGIGRAFARGLARAGWNLALTARREDRLEALAQELRRQQGVDARIIPMDLMRPRAPEELYGAVRNMGKPIRLLCNVAGVDAWGEFSRMALDDQLTMIRLNAKVPVELCHYFYRDLVSQAPSAVINVASQAAFQPVPYMAAYSASKVFLAHFSQALFGEWKDKGILVQTLLPGPTDTENANLPAMKKHGLFKDFLWPESVVEKSLENLALGTAAVVVGRRPIHHRILANLLPSRTLMTALAKQFRPPGSGSG